MLVAQGVWDPKTMVNVEELDPEPFIALLDQMGLPTEIKEIEPGGKDSFNGAVRALEQELAESTATVTDVYKRQHDLLALIQTLRNLRALTGPRLLHVVTLSLIHI